MSTRGSHASLAVEFSLVPSDTEPGLSISLGSFRWVGGGDATKQRTKSNSKTRAVELYCVSAEDSDPGEDLVDWLVASLRRLPLPPRAWRELAHWFWREQPEAALACSRGTHAADSCLRRALDATAPARAATKRHRFTARVIPGFDEGVRGVVDARVVPDGGVWLVTFDAANGYRTHEASGANARVTSYGGARVFLVDPLDDPAEGPLIAVQALDSNTYTLSLARLRDTLPSGARTSVSVALPRPPSTWLIAHGRLVLSCTGETVCMPLAVAADADADADADARAVRFPQQPFQATPSERPLRLGDHLTTAVLVDPPGPRPSPRTLQWVDLRAPGNHVELGTAGSPGALFTHGGLLYATANGALQRAAPGEPAVTLVRGIFHGAAMGEDVVWVGETYQGAPHVLRLRRSDFAPLGRTACALPMGIVAVGRSAVMLSPLEWCVVLADGTLAAASGTRRNTSWARLPDGTTAVNADEDLVIVDPSGAIRRRRTMPYDGTLVGAVGAYFVYAPSNAGVARTTPDAIHFVDAAGESIAMYPLEGPHALYVPQTWRYIDGARALCAEIDARGVIAARASDQALVRLAVDERASDIGVATPRNDAWFAETHERESIVRGVITNPRDEWPESALVVASEALVCRGGTYAGSTGACDAADIEVHDGSVVLLEDCELRGGGVDVQGDAIVILVRCVVGPRAAKTSALGRVFRVECIDL